jgi:hypothetical protein
MKVRFAPDVLNEQSSWDTLDRIVFHFIEQRHIWDIDDPDLIKNSQWLQSDLENRTNRRNLETLEKAFTSSIYPDQTTKMHTLCLVVTSQTVSEVNLSPDDARRCLDAPTYVVVENAESDGAFLEAIMFALNRRLLLDLQADRWWEIAHAGGAGEVPKIVDQIRAKTTGLLRVFVLSDSDRSWPGHVTSTVRKIEEYCKPRNVPYAILFKREIENYLPVSALQRVSRRYQKTYQAFLRLSQLQKDYFDMKKGFDQDENGRTILPHQEQQALFQHIGRSTLKDLCGGFGKEVWQYFASVRDAITEDTIKNTCCTHPGEIDRILDQIESLL